MAIYLRRSALQSRLKALLSSRNPSFVPGSRNCNPDLAPKVPTLKDLTSRIAEKCESLTKNGVEKDDKEFNSELGSSVAGANVDDKPVSVRNLSFVRDRNCNPDMVPNAPTLKDLTSRIAEICETLTKNGVEKDNIEPDTELGSHSMNVAGKVDVSKWRKLDSRKLGIQKSKISPSSWAVLKILHGEGFDTYLVGGCVRDLILNKVPKDFDIITTASLQQMKKLFHRCLIIGKRFPICLVSIRGIPIEVSSFETSSKNSKRKEELVPLQVSFGCDKKDLARWRDSLHRDFTINSLYYDPFVDKVYDYANAMMDLKSLKLRTLVPAQLSFEEDCARILRGLRIAARLGLSFSEETDTAIRKLSSSVTSLAKVFVSPNAGHNTSRLFSMLVDDVEANIQQGRKGFKINYDLLKKGGYEETSFVMGKVITDTLKSGVSQEAAKRRRVLPTTANPVQNQFMGEIVANDRTEKQPVVDAKPEVVAQNQQNKDEKVTYDTILTRVSKLWYKLVRRQTVTEEDQKACWNVEHCDGKENLNFSEDGILEKVNNALPGSVLENGEDGVKKKPKQDDVTEIEVPTSRQLMTVGHDYYPKPVMNMSISHGGVCIFILGVLLSNKMKVQFTQRLPLGSELNMGEERCCLRGLDHLHGPTFHSICGNLMIYKPSLTKDRLIFEHDESLRAHLLPINFPASYKNGKLEHFLHRWMKNHEHNDCWLIMFPEKRYYRETMSTTEVAIHTNLFTDLYASIGTGSSTTGGWYITIMKLPFIFLIWIGFMVASLGGLRSLLRQLRKNKLHWN